MSWIDMSTLVPAALQGEWALGDLGYSKTRFLADFPLWRVNLPGS
jgi:hypothetical protein